MVERIILVSPREPCGVSWLINCLLLLGIKTYRVNSKWNWRKMWIRDSQGWRLDPRENILKQWLPVLSQKKYFLFDDRFEVQWSHNWPTDNDWHHRVLYFIRDPRDALYSRYRREGASLPFIDYLAFPDAFSLLEKIDHWRAFNECWIAHPNLKVVRFEDYKVDALQVIKQVVEWIGLHKSESELINAVDQSTFEKAAEAERQYLKITGCTHVINRAGIPGEWRNLSSEVKAMAEISMRCASLLHYFGYEAPYTTDGSLGYRTQFTHLKYFASVRLKELMKQAVEGVNSDLLPFIKRLNPQLLREAGLSYYEAHVMLDSLSEYAYAAGWQESLARLGRLYDAMGTRRAWWSKQKWRLRTMLKRLLCMVYPKQGV